MSARWLRAKAALLACLVAAPLGATEAAAQGVVNIYSYREPALMDPLLKAFTAKTGIIPRVVFASAGLNERMAAEGANSPADILLTVDAGRLSEAKAAGLTQAVKSPELATIPAAFRDPENHWFGLTMRARVVFASKERVKLDAISYEALAEPKWRGKICARPGQHVYNISLIASLIAHKGEAWVADWLKGVRANLARKPAGGDREAVRDVHSGLCDIAIANTYYMAAMLKNPDQKAWAESVRILFPNASDRGTHVNISGIALARHAPNRDNAIQLMAFLASEAGQRIYAEVNNEYPVSPNVEPSAVVKGWGTLNPDGLSLEQITRHRKRASELVDRAGFDAGPSQ